MKSKRYSRIVSQFHLDKFAFRPPRSRRKVFTLACTNSYTHLYGACKTPLILYFPHLSYSFLTSYKAFRYSYTSGAMRARRKRAMESSVRSLVLASLRILGLLHNYTLILWFQAETAKRLEAKRARVKKGRDKESPVSSAESYQAHGSCNLYIIISSLYTFVVPGGDCCETCGTAAAQRHQQSCPQCSHKRGIYCKC
jgi:hypothetical protein